MSSLYFFFLDIVFFIFLYQRWIYKVDHKRVNEFGFSGEMADEAGGKKLAITGETAAQPTAGAIEDTPPLVAKPDTEKKTD